jgi:hypothetical protein
MRRKMLHSEELACLFSNVTGWALEEATFYGSLPIDPDFSSNKADKGLFTVIKSHFQTDPESLEACAAFRDQPEEYDAVK